MQFIDKKIKLSTIFPNKRITSINSKLSYFPIKVIPAYIENEERIIQRRLIMNSHVVFKKEKNNKYKSIYLNKVFTGLYENKKNYSQERNQHYNTNFSRNNSCKTLPDIINSTITTKQDNIKKSPILLKNRSCTNGIISKENKGKKLRLHNGIPFAFVKST